MPTLASFQRSFQFPAVHLNTSAKGLVDALAANYPTILQLVGEEYFTACAVEYARAYPARSPALVLYGESFPSFLSASDLPYLPDVARIDRLWIEAYTARDAEPLPAHSLASLAPEVLFEQRVTLHPAARFAWLSHSAVSIWMSHRSGALEVDGSEEGILLTRPHQRIETLKLSRADYVFLQCISTGATLGEASTSALAVNAHINIAGILNAGAFI